MKNLSDLSDLGKGTIISLLWKFCEEYENWIVKKKNDIPTLDGYFQLVAGQHIATCFDSLKRMKAGVTLLEKDEQIFTAFCLANRAMFMQRLHSDLQLTNRFPGDEPVKWPQYEKITSMFACWRPFQLAFILLNISGISSYESADRDLVDLIWFPTGGGKTEAYLGLTAYTMAIRRLQGDIEGFQGDHGVAVLMRYTLRLLTLQQFHRAASLLCA